MLRIKDQFLFSKNRGCRIHNELTQGSYNVYPDFDVLKYLSCMMHSIEARGDEMPCRFNELRKKEVINARNGCRIGFVDDLEIDMKCARITALIVYGRPKLFGLFGRSDDCVISWENIRLIGEDAILVENFVQKTPISTKKRKNFVTFCHH